MDSKSIRVRIYGSEYPLKADDENLTRKAANLIDTMMMDIHSKIPDQPPVTLAVLSALNVTESLFQEQEEKVRASQKVEKEIRSVAHILDKALGPS